MSHTVNAEVAIDHYGYGFEITPNGDVEMRVPLSQLKTGDVITQPPYGGDKTCVVIRKLKDCNVTPVKLVP